MKPKIKPMTPGVPRAARLRAYLASVVVTLGLAGAGMKAWALQVDDGEHYRELALKSHDIVDLANLPEGATGFTTIEVKSNFLGTATEGSLTARATMVHGGRTTQVWDAPVLHEQTGKTIALFRCTQMVLWPK